MQEGFTTATEEMRAMGFGSGMGLPNIKKNTDDMEITSEVGKGTRLADEVLHRDRYGAEETGKVEMTEVLPRSQGRPGAVPRPHDLHAGAARRRPSASGTARRSSTEDLCVDCGNCISCARAGRSCRSPTRSPTMSPFKHKVVVPTPVALLAVRTRRSTRTSSTSRSSELGFDEVVDVEHVLRGARQGARSST